MTRTLDRRDFLRLGLAGGAVSLASACGWEGGPLVPGLKSVSRLNDWMSEHVFLSNTRLAREYPVSRRTRDFPTYYIHRGPDGRLRPPVLEDPAAWALEVAGEVRHPTRFTLEMLQALPRVGYTVKHHCVEGWTAIGSWAGVPVASIMAMVQPTDRARYVRFDSFDAGPRRGGGLIYYSNGWDLKSASHPQTILAYAHNDRPLMPDHGGPLRLYSPIKLGYKLTKYLTRLTFTTDRPGGYWEDQGYPWFGGI
ncbi:MAG: molybdopterin-dependent oxidoreductase [Gemmatimonadales bacterium]